MTELPTVRELACLLLEEQAEAARFEDGGHEVTFVLLNDSDGRPPGWDVVPTDNLANLHKVIESIGGTVFVPSDPLKFDAWAEAERLLESVSHPPAAAPASRP